MDRRGPKPDGFSLIEVVVALFLATIVLGSVFALLSRGARSTRTETERADVQSQARSALERINSDILEAGANLPPEFPSVVPSQVGADLSSLVTDSTDAMEVVRGLERDGMVLNEPLRVTAFDGETATLASTAGFLQPGDLVLLFDNEPTNGVWLLGAISEIESATRVRIETEPGSAAGGVYLPMGLDRYQRVTADKPYPASGFLAPVMVVTYFGSRAGGLGTADGDDSRGQQVLMRRVNWGDPQPLVSTERLQIRYEMASTLNYVPPRPKVGDVRINNRPPTPAPSPTGEGPHKPKPPSEDATQARTPPIPQPDPSQPIQQVVSAVVVTVTSASASENLEGSRSSSRGGPGRLRATLTSRISLRNILAALGARDGSQAYN